ncbi:MAG: type IV pilus assembly protein PilM [Thermoguttaceae bacterium]|nr:type IV pilus assembly protein PilM [Thermoguttaceae bacterium]
MARTAGVWGIDIGNCALKALRCHVNREDGTIVADAFDYIEYPNILTEPDVVPGDLVHDALVQFLSRNTIKGDKVAISVAGKNGITRFIKLPPVEAKRIPDLVKYEAKQVIPFDLKDVILDYQRLGGDKMSDMALEVDIGLFAMKRDIVYNLLEPFDDAHIPVDFVQLTPISLYNMAMHEYMTNIPSPEEYDPENPPPFIGFLSMGTDNTDLVLTNGYKVWVRDIPIGGNQFTKALTTEMKLTFAKAEHLKRNANASTDKKALFQSMRSVFSNFVDEIQRSIRYFISLDRYATIDKIIGLGNAVQLAGLRKYLEQNLGITVEVANDFNNINLTDIKNNPSFTDNVKTFGVCYGLCLQGLGASNLGTNFLPREIVHARIINSKKPWMSAAAALMLLGATISFGSHVSHWQASDESTFKSLVSQAKSITDEVSTFNTQRDEEDKKYNDNKVIGNDLLANAGRSVEWLELMKIIDAALPSDPEGVNIQDIPIQRRNQVQIENIEAQPFGKVELWKEYVTKARYYKPNASESSGSSEQEADGSATGEQSGETASDSSSESSETGTASKTWLVQITGYHYHNRLPDDKTVAPEGANFVRERIIKNLQEGRIKLALPATFASWVEEQTFKMQNDQADDESGDAENPDGAPSVSKSKKFVPLKAEGDDKDGVWYTMQQMGISYPVLIEAPGICEIKKVVVPLYEDRKDDLEVSGIQDSGRGMADAEGPTGAVESNKSKTVELNKYPFIIQFLWTPTDPLQREIDRQATLRKEEEERIAKEQAEREAAQNEEAEDSSEDSASN